MQEPPPPALVPDDGEPPPPGGLAAAIFSPWLLMLVALVVGVTRCFSISVEELHVFDIADLAFVVFLAGIVLRRWRRGVLNRFMTAPILGLGCFAFWLACAVSGTVGFVHAMWPRPYLPALPEPAARSFLSYTIAVDPRLRELYVRAHPREPIPKWPGPVPQPYAQPQGRAPAGRPEPRPAPQGPPSPAPPPAAAAPRPPRPEREMHALPGLVVTVPGWPAAEEDTRAELGRLRLYDPAGGERYVEVFWAKSEPMSPVELAEMWTGSGSRVITNAVAKVSGHEATRLELALPDGSRRRFVTCWNCPEHERRLYLLCDLDRPREELLRLHEEIAASVRCHLPLEAR